MVNKIDTLIVDNFSFLFVLRGKKQIQFESIEKTNLFGKIAIITIIYPLNINLNYTRMFYGGDHGLLKQNQQEMKKCNLIRLYGAH